MRHSAVAHADGSDGGQGQGVYGMNGMTGSDALRSFMPTGSGDDGEFRASAGHPLEPGEAVASREEMVEALKTVHDPDIPVNIYALGLIYEMELDEDGSARIEMTLTTPGCPEAGEMRGIVADAVRGWTGIERGEVTI